MTRKFDNKLKDWGYLAYRWTRPFFDPVRCARAVPGYVGYFRDWIHYRRLGGSERIRFRDTYPILDESTPTSPFDRHYFYQDIWAFRKIHASAVKAHVDVGSRVDLIGFLTAITHVTYIDIRPLEAELPNLESRKGSILELPYTDRSVPSLSCLHVAEHIGLGRYGDPIDPAGTEKACAELARVLAPEGRLYFSLPVGRPRICFNAHRIHAPETIIDYFADLELEELSAIGDDGRFRENVALADLADTNYACGLYRFRRPG